jgi:hypothetical protein
MNVKLLWYWPQLFLFRVNSINRGTKIVLPVEMKMNEVKIKTVFEQIFHILVSAGVKVT